ncbi:metal-sensitive transcriptional regulator [Listeria aquatica]|uniref:Metal-sensitive transcriptional regulator n=1 Tax=Listeria aquatica TaxID=1494960 RepID=A0A841ZM48_9LIST|nr:metal-sensitive transcriptional regulator [Listeria aquatica]MBC1520597.1 metal-sensitive transcriptional regulator [Listeria aquatica]
MEANEKQALVNRLRRAEGQVRGLEQMVETERSAKEILTQLTATREALKKVGLAILEEEIRNFEAAGEKEDQASVEALMGLVRQITKG